MIDTMLVKMLFTFIVCWFIQWDMASSHQQQKVLLVSLDGFRWDFLNKTKTPNLSDIVKNGVSVEYVQNVFPTTTLPNHQSMVTGLYPENHGIIGNQFFNPVNGEIYAGQTESKWWNQSKPIWIVNQQQRHKSGVCFWPGHSVKYGNITPDYLPDKKYNGAYKREKEKFMSLDDRVKLAVNWLKKDDVTFVAFYTATIDEIALDNAPDSNYTYNKLKMRNSLQSIDEMVGNLKTQLKKENLTSSVNVIFIGDHGFVNTTFRQEIKLDNYINTMKEEDIRFISGFTNVFLYTALNSTDSIYKKLKQARKNESNHFKVYLKKDIPDYFHIKNNKNTCDILILPDPGWIVINKRENTPYLKGNWERGEHGYSNFIRDMNPGFLGFGPMFRSGFRKNCIKTVDLYSLMCYIIGIKPNRHDGNFDRVESLLKEFSNKTEKKVHDTFDPIQC